MSLQVFLGKNKEEKRRGIGMPHACIADSPKKKGGVKRKRNIHGKKGYRRGTEKKRERHIA